MTVPTSRKTCGWICKPGILITFWWFIWKERNKKSLNLLSHRPSKWPLGSKKQLWCFMLPLLLFTPKCWWAAGMSGVFCILPSLLCFSFRYCCCRSCSILSCCRVPPFCLLCQLWNCSPGGAVVGRGPAFFGCVFCAVPCVALKVGVIMGVSLWPEAFVGNQVLFVLLGLSFLFCSFVFSGPVQISGCTP
jgi:hypothetical protein